VRVGRGDGGHGLAPVQHLAAGQAVAAQVVQLDRAFAQVGDAVAGVGQVGGGDDRLDARRLKRLADLDAADDAVGVRAAEDAAVQEARHGEVGAVQGAAGNLVGAVVADGAGANDLVFHGRDQGLGVRSQQNGGRNAMV